MGTQNLILGHLELAQYLLMNFKNKWNMNFSFHCPEIFTSTYLITKTQNVAWIPHYIYLETRAPCIIYDDVDDRLRISLICSRRYGKSSLLHDFRSFRNYVVRTCSGMLLPWLPRNLDLRSSLSASSIKELD